MINHFKYEKYYYEFCREEQNIVALLYSILLNDSDNLERFLKLLNVNFTTDDIINSEVYFEYSFIRDLWYQFTANGPINRINNNKLKKEFILNFVKRKKIHIDERIVNNSIESFNKYFGCNSKIHIQSPGKWRVISLKENVYENYLIKEDFLELCKFKWSFNIKPDLVLKLGSEKIICIEAKLESGESSYPSESSEKKLWNEIFGNEMNRVKQIDLQSYMLSEVLELQDVESYIIDTKGSSHNSKSWSFIFNHLKINNSFISKFIESNKYLR